MEPPLFVRKFLGKKYGLLSIPKPVYSTWIEKGYSHATMMWDDTTETLTVHPC